MYITMLGMCYIILNLLKLVVYLLVLTEVLFLFITHDVFQQWC